VKLIENPYKLRYHLFSQSLCQILSLIKMAEIW